MYRASIHRRKPLLCALRRTPALFAILIFIGTVQAQPSLESRLAETLRNLPHAEAVVGAYVLDLHSGRTVFALNADRPLIPASTQKIPTIAAALRELKPDFRFRTRLATNGTDLFIIGDGDPGLGDDKLHRARDESIDAPLRRWSHALRSAGITALPGQIVLDESIFDGEWLHPTWEAEDIGKWYAAPVGALNYNDNCVDITVWPADRPDAPVNFSVVPDAPIIQVINRCLTGGQGNPILHHPPGTFEYRISGRCSRRWPFGSVAFTDPGLLLADSFRTVLTREGITVAPTYRRERVRRPDGSLPSGLTVLDVHETALSDVLGRIGKDSQNLFAECVLKRTGYAWARRHGAADPTGSWALGRRAVHEMLEEAGIGPAGFVIEDGSGLSRNNQCTARQLANLLAWSSKQPWGHELHDSLAVAGVDGSIRRRLQDLPDRIFAKTGTMRGIRALAGYIDIVGSPQYAFAVIFNGYRGPSTPYREIHDRFCRVLVDAAEKAAESAGTPGP